MSLTAASVKGNCPPSQTCRPCAKAPPLLRPFLRKHWGRWCTRKSPADARGAHVGCGIHMCIRGYADVHADVHHPDKHISGGKGRRRLRLGLGAMKIFGRAGVVYYLGYPDRTRFFHGRILPRCNTSVRVLAFLREVRGRVMESARVSIGRACRNAPGPCAHMRLSYCGMARRLRLITTL